LSGGVLSDTPDFGTVANGQADGIATLRQNNSATDAADALAGSFKTSCLQL
jgi:hypothetical protein